MNNELFLRRIVIVDDAAVVHPSKTYRSKELFEDNAKGLKVSSVAEMNCSDGDSYPSRNEKFYLHESGTTIK